MKREHEELCAKARKQSRAIYIAASEPCAEDVSASLIAMDAAIRELSAEVDEADEIIDRKHVMYESIGRRLLEVEAELAKVKAHAEAMSEAFDDGGRDWDGVIHDLDVAVTAYRADFKG